MHSLMNDSNILPHLPSLKSLLASSKTSVSLLLEGLSISSLFSERAREHASQQHAVAWGDHLPCRYSRCTVLMSSLYLLRNSLLCLGSFSLFCESVGWKEKAPTSASFCCCSALFGPSEPF